MYFTYHYKQPDEYHFSLDSIYLARFVAGEMADRGDLSSLQVLDLCAGCGVIGIELSWHLRALRHFKFIEIQEVYTEFFNQNIANINRPELHVDWHLMNYDELHKEHWSGAFDLIVSNPPYFLHGHGLLSPSDFKNRCRFYMDSSFEHYIKALKNALADNGKAYFLMRPLKHHGFDLFDDITQILDTPSISVKRITHIRGSDVILLEKTNAHQCL